VSHILVDSPVPEVEPGTDSDAARDRAEFTERLLSIDGESAGTNDNRIFASCLKRSSVTGSAFVYFHVDPYGNGWKPMEMMAHPMAESADAANVDPMSGLETDESQLVRKFVTAEGTLTDDRGLAEKQWLPKVVPEIVSPYQVRPVPETADSVDDAEGMMILSPRTLGQLKNQYESVKALDPENLEHIVGWKPTAAKWALSWFLQDNLKVSLPRGPDGEPDDDEIVWTLGYYVKACPSYPMGVYILTAGGKHLLHAGEWSKEVETEQGTTTLALDLPFAQCKQLLDEDSGDFYGKGVVEDLGPADSVRMEIIDAWLAHKDRFLYPHTFLPIGSNVQPEQMANRGVAPIYVNPAGTPVVETVPPFLPDGIQLLDRATYDMNDALGLYASAQGASDPSIRSGKHAEVEVSQGSVNLSQLKRNATTFIERYWRVKLQHWRAFCTIPQRVAFVGDDGAYKEREWAASDLSDVSSVRVKRGSFTQLTPEQKEQTVLQLLQLGRIEESEADRILASSVSVRLGRLDNPHRSRVRRQLAEFKAGPPEGWAEMAMQAKQSQEMAQRALQEAEAQGIPSEQAQTMIPPPESVRTPFEPLPVDEEPPVAKVRHIELSRAMADASFTKFPPEWQQLLTDSYEKSRQDAGLILPREQAEQAQAQQQEAQQGAKEAVVAEHQMEMEKQDDQQQHEVEIAQLQIQGKLMEAQADSETKLTLQANEPPPPPPPPPAPAPAPEADDAPTIGKALDGLIDIGTDPNQAIAALQTAGAIPPPLLRATHVPVTIEYDELTGRPSRLVPQQMAMSHEPTLED